MTYNVFSGTLNPTQSITKACVCYCGFIWLVKRHLERLNTATDFSNNVKLVYFCKAGN